MASSSSSSQSCNYDVFLSFRGEDTRKTFVDHLYFALVDRNIITYKDDETLPRGESIRPSLFKAIEGSRIAVIIFSKNYADSSWCLDELTYIMKCKVKIGIIVMPVFYDVTPSEVRKQEGDFGRGFAKQEVQNISKVESWRKALVDASDISGWEPKTSANGHEAKVIKEIADTISKKLFSVTSSGDDDEGLVGMSVHLEELEAELDIGLSDDVKLVGIWGVGGSGKTTLAYSLYKKISHHFQGGHCIINNIREESKKHGLETQQEKLISRLLKTEMKLQSVEEGKDMIRSRLNRRNVLIILDDVDNDKQLDALAGSLNWFGSGSRIIVTTRDEHLLRNHVVFPIRLLSDEEAIQLFNKKAYNKKLPLKDYNALSLRVVSYAARLPLALKVLGSFLYDKDEKQWMSTLDRLKDTPQTEILEQLKISYDGLESLEKEIFLDIACFLRWWRIDEAMEIHEACGYHPDVGIQVLRQKALITTENGHFDMHDLVQEMGHHIVRGEHPNDPRKQSRLWNGEQIKSMCHSDATTENDQIEAIGCKIYHYRQDPAIFSKIISNMKKLRYLDVYPYGDDADKNAKGPKFLSNELRYLNWSFYPRSPFPDTFKPSKLVILKLYCSWPKKLWKGYKHLPHLKVLQLSDMENLVSTPDFDGLPNLQKLTLRFCTRLEKIHPSLGKHTSLEHVTVEDCYQLRMFPTIIGMAKLKTLEIKSCHESLNLPEIKSNMDSLERLSLHKVGIDSSVVERCPNLNSLHLLRCRLLQDIEFNVAGLKQLEELVLNGLKYVCRPIAVAVADLTWFSCSIGIFISRRYPERSLQLELPCNLRKLDIGFCNLKDGEIPSCIGGMSNLEDLNLSGNYFTRLDFSLSQLTQLKSLDISYTSLAELPKLIPSSLIVFKANYCTSLTTTGDFLTNCKEVCHVSLIGVRILNGCSSKILESMLQGKANHRKCLVVEGIEIAKEFIPPLLIRGNRCRLKLSENWYNDFSGFLMYAVATKIYVHGFISVSMEHVLSSMETEDIVAWEESDSERDERTWVWYVSFASLRHTHTSWWNSISKPISISFQFQIHGLLEGCSGFGVRMVAMKSGSCPNVSLKTQEEEYEFSRYTPNFFIDHHSQYLLNITS